MAKQKSFIKLKGSLGGLTFYENQGNDVVRTTGGVEKERIMSDAAFIRTRENMMEFGASATVGKALRMGFANIIRSMADSYVSSRITGIMKRINSVGPGIRGERDFEILNNKNLIEGFEFNKKSPFDAIFYAPYDDPTLDANRSIATWVVPDFNTSNYLNAPEGATHFRLLLAVTVLSDYAYVDSRKGYEAVEPAENETNGMVFSAEIPVGGMVGSDTTLVVDLGFAAALPLTVAVINAIGIIFYQQINGAFYELATDNAMKIVFVG